MRLLGNAGADGDITTLGDNLAYQIGFSRVGGAVLEDGATLRGPQGVTVMIDANAILKLRRAYIGVGSLSQGVNRSAGSLQVLGTPRLFNASGSVIKDRTGQPIAGSVYFTSLHDTAVGKDKNPDTSPPAAQSGDWGGIIFRNDLDIADCPAAGLRAAGDLPELREQRGDELRWRQRGHQRRAAGRHAGVHDRRPADRDVQHDHEEFGRGHVGQPRQL